MAKGLERDLSLYALMTVSIGAMVGSGIFVLPGLATDLAGSAVVLAYVLAGVAAIPAALSLSEMSTAVPESGGVYLYIDRAMGPLMGTVAGFGVWVSLILKAAFALVGLGAYIALFADTSLKLVALGLAVLLIAVNLLGSKRSGQFQAVAVTIVFAALIIFIGDGLTNISNEPFRGFFDEGVGGIFAATGLVFLSYAGVLKVGSVAEEVEDPSRNIPLGMFASLLVMIVIYGLLAYVAVGVATGPGFAESLTPMADVAEVTLGGAGVVAIAITAVFALTSAANAGLLSASRYPFAMARDDLAPDKFTGIHARFGTPVLSIIFTGAVMLALIAFVPVKEIAKLASGFMILVLSLVNLALIALREGDLDWYEPDFRSPFYPWMQLFGIGSGIFLLAQMGAVAIGGAVCIILLGIAWFHFYGRRRVVREGAAAGAIRRSTENRHLEETRATVSLGPRRVLVPVRPNLSLDRIERMVGVAADLVRAQGGEVHVVQFEEVPDSLALADAIEPSERDEALEETIHNLDTLGVDVHVQEVVTHNVNRSVIHHAHHHDMDLIVAEREGGSLGKRLFGQGLGPFLRRSRHDVVFVKPRATGPVKTVAVVADRGPYDPLKVSVADAVAAHHGARIRFIYPIRSETPSARKESLDQYHEDLAKLTKAPVEATYIQQRDRVNALGAAAQDAEVVVVGASASRVFTGGHFGILPWRVGEMAPGTVLYVHSHRMRRRRILRYLIERISY